MFLLVCVQEHTINVVDNNPVTPVASLRPLRFEFVPKTQPPNSPDAVGAASCTSATHAWSHADSESSGKSSHACAVVDTPEDWIPTAGNQQAEIPREVKPSAHACAARVCGKPGSGYFSLQTFGGAKPAVESYVLQFGTRAQQQSAEHRFHNQDASCASELKKPLQDIVFSGGDVPVGCSEEVRSCSGRDAGSPCDSSDRRFHSAPPEATGAAVAACLEVVGKGVHQQPAICERMWSFFFESLVCELLLLHLSAHREVLRINKQFSCGFFTCRDCSTNLSLKDFSSLGMKTVYSTLVPVSMSSNSVTWQISVQSLQRKWLAGVM